MPPPTMMMSYSKVIQTYDSTSPRLTEENRPAGYARPPSKRIPPYTSPIPRPHQNLTQNPPLIRGCAHTEAHTPLHLTHPDPPQSLNENPQPKSAKRAHTAFQPLTRSKPRGERILKLSLFFP
jgi:hypothetical protein